MTELRSCEGCARRVFVTETECPFCKVRLAPERPSIASRLRAGMSRAQILAVAAVTAVSGGGLAACAKTTAPMTNAGQGGTSGEGGSAAVGGVGTGGVGTGGVGTGGVGTGGVSSGGHAGVAGVYGGAPAPGGFGGVYGGAPAPGGFGGMYGGAPAPSGGHGGQMEPSDAGADAGADAAASDAGDMDADL